jgi:hypothetical protein
VRKPDPEHLHATARALGRATVIFVGDSEVDAETAQAAGLPFVLFTEGYRKAPADQIPHQRRVLDLGRSARRGRRAALSPAFHTGPNIQILPSRPPAASGPPPPGRRPWQRRPRGSMPRRAAPPFRFAPLSGWPAFLYQPAMAITLSTLADLAAFGFDDIIDARAPAEYAEDHLPGAISLPVLSDAERAEVGTIYKQVNPFTAKKLGAALVARNVASHLLGPWRTSRAAGGPWSIAGAAASARGPLPSFWPRSAGGSKP